MVCRERRKAEKEAARRKAQEEEEAKRAAEEAAKKAAGADSLGAARVHGQGVMDRAAEPISYIHPEAYLL
jgi:hypothetical protein